MLFKPLSVAAFALTLLSTVLMLVGFFLPAWYVIYVPGDERRHWHGIWFQQTCLPSECNSITFSTRLKGGQEVFFISRVFVSLATLLVALACVFHVVYSVLALALGSSRSFFRQTAIYALCGAGLFGLMASLMFVSQYGRLGDYESQRVDTGPCFPLTLTASLLCLLSSAATAWASYRKANYDEGPDDCQDITHEMECDFDNQPKSEK